MVVARVHVLMPSLDAGIVHVLDDERLRRESVIHRQVQMELAAVGGEFVVNPMMARKTRTEERGIDRLLIVRA